MDSFPQTSKPPSRPVSLYGSAYSTTKLARMGLPAEALRRGSMGDLPRMPPAPKLDHEDLFTKDMISLWDGQTRVQRPWDSLRRDPTLYDLTADCSVHFYANGRSQRGPSLRVPREAVRAAGCLQLLASYSKRTALGSSTSSSPTTSSPMLSNQNSKDSGYSSAVSDDICSDLYIPPPPNVSGADALDWHITTRNLFAWIMDKPLVGTSLGQTLIDLLERLLISRPATEDSVSDLLAYADRQGYLNIANSPDYALGVLAFAEHAQLVSLRAEAFTHCVGMMPELFQRSEYERISSETQTAITKSYLQMDVDLSRASTAISNFVEDDLSPGMVALTQTQRAHLDRFRSFLSAFYVNKLGYWPPPVFSKQLMVSMRHEFECLFALLVKDDSCRGPSSHSGPTSQCVLQNTTAFDQRHSYSPLTSKGPLSPRSGHVQGRALHASGLSGMLKSRSNRRALLVTVRRDLLAATNQGSLLECGLVQAYLGFEQDSLLNLEPELTIADARHVRWIQIYFVVQVLKSATESAVVAASLEEASYHTCCKVPAYVRPSNSRYSSLLIHPAHRSPENTRPSSFEATESDAFSIHPDCEDDHYFAPKPILTSTRRNSMAFMPLPLRVSTGPFLNRATSLLSRRTSTRSIAGSRPLRARKISNHPEPLYPITTQTTLPDHDSSDDVPSPFDPVSRPRSPVLDFSALVVPESPIHTVHDRETPTSFSAYGFDFHLSPSRRSSHSSLNSPFHPAPLSIPTNPASYDPSIGLARSTSSHSSDSLSTLSSTSSHSAYSLAPSSASSTNTVLPRTPTTPDALFAPAHQLKTNSAHASSFTPPPRAATWASAYDECVVALDDIQELTGREESEQDGSWPYQNADDEEDGEDDEQRRGRGVERKLTVHHYREHMAALLARTN